MLIISLKSPPYYNWRKDIQDVIRLCMTVFEGIKCSIRFVSFLLRVTLTGMR